jgi:hypothetical protein
MRDAWVIFGVGLAAGLLDLIPLVMVDAPVFNMVAIVVFWLVAVFFMARTTLLANPLLNGLVVAVLIMLPVVLIVYTVNPKDFLPMLSMAVILGPLAGIALHRGLGERTRRVA